MFKFSIIVLMYNSRLEKLLLTLESILRQDLRKLEIIISDDGSKVDNFELIKEFLECKGFNDFILIKNKENIGTVDNFLNAIQNSSGKYIKGLGAGDLLYNSDTLTDLYDFMEIKNAKFCFGRMKSYLITEHDLGIVYNEFVAPKLINSYIGKTNKKMLENMLINTDWISGATMVFERNYVISKLIEISGIVRLCEDLMQVLVCLEGESIHYYENEIIWYEYGDGISTSGEAENRLVNDHIRFNTYLYDTYTKDKTISRAYKNLELRNIENTFKRRVLKIIYNRSIILFRVKLKLKSLFIKTIKMEIGFLDEMEFKSIVRELYGE